MFDSRKSTLIALRPDLSLLLSQGETAIEAHLDVPTASELAINLVKKLLSIDPSIAAPLAEDLWRITIAHLSDQQLAAIIAKPIQPGRKETE